MQSPRHAGLSGLGDQPRHQENGHGDRRHGDATGEPRRRGGRPPRCSYPVSSGQGTARAGSSAALLRATSGTDDAAALATPECSGVATTAGTQVIIPAPGGAKSECHTQPTVTSARTGPTCRSHARNSWHASPGFRMRSSVAGRPCWPRRSRRCAPAMDSSRPPGRDVATIGWPSPGISTRGRVGFASGCGNPHRHPSLRATSGAATGSSVGPDDHPTAMRDTPVLRPLDDHRPVGHRHRPGRSGPGARHGCPAADPRPGQSAPGDVPSRSARLGRSRGVHHGSRHMRRCGLARFLLDKSHERRCQVRDKPALQLLATNPIAVTVGQHGHSLVPGLFARSR